MGQPHDWDVDPGVWTRRLERASGFSKEVLYWRIKQSGCIENAIIGEQQNPERFYTLVKELIESSKRGLLPADFFGEAFGSPMIKLWAAHFAELRYCEKFEVVFPTDPAEGRFCTYAGLESDGAEPAMEIPISLAQPFKEMSHFIEEIGIQELAPFLNLDWPVPDQVEFDRSSEDRIVVTMTWPTES